MHVVGFIIRIYHDARSPELQFITMQGHLNVNLSRCTVTWTSVYHDARSPERQFITMHGHLNVNLSRCTVTWTSIYHDARSLERQFITMHGQLNVKQTRYFFTPESLRLMCQMCEQNVHPFSLQIFLQTFSTPLNIQSFALGMDLRTSVCRSAGGVRHIFRILTKSWIYQRSGSSYTCSGFQAVSFRQTDRHTKSKPTSAYCQLRLRRRRKLALYGAAQSLATLDM